jgi:hypothetical protein
VRALAYDRHLVRVHAVAALIWLGCATARAQEPPPEGEPPPPAEDPEAGFEAPASKPAPAPPDPEEGAPVLDPETGETPAPSEAPAALEGEPPPAPEAAEPAPAAEPEYVPPITFAEPPTEDAAAAEQPSDAPCDPEQQSCPCPKNWGCWELVYATKGTILGVKVTVTYSDANAPEELDAGFLTVYATEHYATRNNLSVHVQASAAIGGGTANNEGALGGSLDVGWRGAITETGGPFLRAGMSGLMTGHRAFYVSLFEPFQGRLGYQILDGDDVFEVGMTHGIIPVGHFEPGEDVKRDLSRTKELGGYAAFHRAGYRADASFLHIFDPEPGNDRDDVELARAAYCDYRLGLALCADALFTRGEARKNGRERMTNSLYFGITLGLTP